MPAPTAANTIAVIDADGILFAAALKGETTCDGQQMQMLSLGAVYKDCMKRIEAQMDAAGADTAFLALSDRRNFRYSILATYKGNRKDTPRPLMLDALRARISEDCPHKVWLIEGLEADDVCGIAYGQLTKAGKQVVIVSPDKDLLTIPCTLVTPTENATKFHTTVVTEAMADRAHMKQTLTGDTTDHYKGLPGWGERRAGDLLDLFDLAELPAKDRWEVIVEKFEEEGFTREDCLVQARVSRILRLSDWDKAAKQPILFTFPE